MSDTDTLTGSGHVLGPMTPSPAVVWSKSVPIASNTTTVVKATAGTYMGLICTNVGVAWTAQVFDNIAGSGTALTGVITATIGLLGGGQSVGGVGCDIGITVVTAGTTPGSLYALFA